MPRGHIRQPFSHGSQIPASVRAANVLIPLGHLVLREVAEHTEGVA